MTRTDPATLAYVVTEGRGAGDRLLAAVADRLLAEGHALAGVVQENITFAPDRSCHMDLRLLGRPERLRISQDRGPLARGCRLDAGRLEEAVALVEDQLDRHRPALLILNKFGKHEAEGRGFRPVIGRALADGLPVLTAVSALNLPALQTFAEGLAIALVPDEEAVLFWARAAAAAAVA